MQSQQTINPNMVVDLFLLLAVILRQYFEIKVREVNDQYLYLWQSEPFVQTDFIRLGNREKHFFVYLLPKQVLRFFVFVYILQICDDTSPIRYKFIFPLTNFTLDQLLLALLIAVLYCLYFWQRFLLNRPLLETYRNLGLLSDDLFFFENQRMFLVPDTQKINHGIFFFLSQIFVIEIDLKSRARNKLVFATTFFYLAFFLFFGVSLSNHFNYLLLKEIWVLLIHTNLEENYNFNAYSQNTFLRPISALCATSNN